MLWRTAATTTLPRDHSPPKATATWKCRRNRRPPRHVTIDFDRLIDRFFWDTDVLESAAVCEPLDPLAKQSWGANPETFTVIQGLTPHPAELRPEVCGEGEGRDIIRRGSFLVVPEMIALNIL